jgi:hypothetical protein
MRREFQEGYLEGEIEFTESELYAYHDYRGTDKDEKERLRLDLLTKRDIFRKYWEVKHGI